MPDFRSRKTALSELEALLGGKTSYAQVSKEDLEQLSLNGLLSMYEGYRLRNRSNFDFALALRGEADEQLVQGLDVVGEADEINIQRSLANRIRKEDGLGLLPSQEVSVGNASLQAAQDFMAHFRAELLRRQWQQLTLSVTAVRYGMVDDNLSPLAYQNPDGTWFDEKTAESMGCESDRVFAPKLWSGLTQGLGDNPELIEWDQAKDDEWILQVRTAEQAAKAKEFYCPEEYAALDDKSLKNRLAKTTTHSNKADALFALSSPFGSAARDYSPLAWTRKLLEAEKLRRAVKSLAPTEATHAVWRDWNDRVQDKALLVAFEDDAAGQSQDYSGKEQFILDPRFVDFCELFYDEGLCYYFLDLNPAAK